VPYMRLIGAGLPRTATLTQKAALEMLGLAPCHHMVSVFADMAESERWRAALDGQERASEILSDHPACVDWPAAYFYKDLMEDLPDAKVLLSVRSADGWARSMRATIWECLYGDSLVGLMAAAQSRVDPQWDAWSETLREMWTVSGLLNGSDTTDEWMIDAFNRHNDAVKAYVPAERLLVWQPQDGWEPLCTFLELPVPAAPLPHINDSDSFGDMIIDNALRAIQESRAAVAV
jgi:hypothetical protein